MTDLMLENERLSLLLAKREEENHHLKQTLSDTMAESNSKDQAIAKATKVIGILTQDLDQSWNTLKASEAAKSKLQSENRELEKELMALKRSSQEIATMKSKEKRNKTEKLKLQEELNQTARDFGNKENELMKKHGELQDENKRLLGKLEAAQARIKDLQEKITGLEKELTVSEELVKSLEFRLEESAIAIERFEAEKTALLTNSQNEISLIKREAENKIRVLQNLKDTGRPAGKGIRSTNGELGDERLDKTLKKRRGVSNNRRGVEEEPVSMDPEEDFGESKPMFAEFLKETINESVEKERRLLEKLDKILNREARSLGEKLEGFYNQELGLRPEVERWIMKCEELGMRLEDSQRKMANMTTIIRDFEKLVSLNKKLNTEEKKNSDNLARELETNVNFFQVEVQEKNKNLRDNFSQNYDNIAHLLETSQGKIQDLLQNIAFLQQNNNLLKQDRDFLFSNFNDHKREVQSLIAQVLTLQKRLDLDMDQPDVDSGKSESLEGLIHFEEVFSKVQDLQEKVLALERENYGLKTEKNNEKYVFESERLQITEQLNYLQDNLGKMNKRLEECNVVIENLEQQNQELRSKRPIQAEDPQKTTTTELLTAKVTKKKRKIQTLKKRIQELEKQPREASGTVRNLKKSLGNSMSFEENPSRSILNTAEASSEYSMEFASVKDPELLRQKLTENKSKFQRKLREFELVLRFVEKSLDCLIDNNALLEEKDPGFQELLDRNENLRGWVSKLRAALQILLSKGQRALVAESEFLMKVGSFFAEGLERRDEELESTLESLRLVGGQGVEKLHSVQVARARIVEHLEGFGRKSFRTPKKDLNKNNGESLVFLKEIYSDLKETLAKCSLYSSKLDEKAKKLPNFQMIITEDPRNILKVLDENLIDSEETYRKNLRFIWENFLVSLKETRGFGNNSDFMENQLRHLFFAVLDSQNGKKLQDEVQNLKSAMNLLEISHFQQVLRPEDAKSAELLRRKTLQNNEILEDLIEKAEVLLEVLDLDYSGLDWNEFLKQNPLQFQGRLEGFLERKEQGSGRNSLGRLVFELVKENAGCKIAMNNLAAVMQKYKGIIDELMRTRTVY